VGEATTDTSTRIAAIISNPVLVCAIVRSISAAVSSTFVHLPSGTNVWDVFKWSLDAAIRDIQSHPRGRLFRRLIQFGPLNPDAPETAGSTGEGVLSDPECGSCIDFIFSHMVNRFKGELAELLALEPCIQLVQQLIRQQVLPINVQLFWSDTVQETRHIRETGQPQNRHWGSFGKGADGLLINPLSDRDGVSQFGLELCGVIEVKSMRRSLERIRQQVQSHIARLEGGVRLEGRIWPAPAIDANGIVAIMVFPSIWKLSRTWRWSDSTGPRLMVLYEQNIPPLASNIELLDRGLWKITLAWSQEALEQAAYEMTFWYMSQVGRHVYTDNTLPSEWKGMTPASAGCNAIKMMLYYMMLRYITKRQERRATKLYNIYCFGYPLGVDAEEMLWPEDLVPMPNKK